MGLITKEVEVSLHGSAISYYEGLGYHIPRSPNAYGKVSVHPGTKIMVKTADLKSRCTAPVELECDYCHNHYHTSYSVYSRIQHDGKVYCKHCFHAVFHSGENNHRWNSTIPIGKRKNIRGTQEDRDFKKRVLARDNYTCQVCGRVGGELAAHHLDGFDWCMGRRTDDTNGITLCKSCHTKFHSLYGRGGNTAKQFEEWIGCPIKELKPYTGFVPPAKEVYCIEDDKVFSGSTEAGRYYHVSKSNLARVCDMRLKSCAGKHFLWFDRYNSMVENEFREYLEWVKPQPGYHGTVKKKLNDSWDNLAYIIRERMSTNKMPFQNQ